MGFATLWRHVVTALWWATVEVETVRNGASKKAHGA